MTPRPLRANALLPFIATLFVAGGISAAPASGQEEKTAPRSDEAKERSERLDEMKQIAGSFQLTALQDSARTAASWVRAPLYRWNDPTRRNSDGTLWTWRSGGRPIAVLAIELYPNHNDFGPIWTLEFTSLATGPIELEGGEHFTVYYTDLAPPRPDGTLRWAPAKGGLILREVPDAPAPANTEAERLRQMREMLRRFSAREYYNVKSQDYALRLISHPIERYADEASGLVDGAIFAYANGTNPEVLVVIEAQRQGAGPLSWQYAAAPLTRAEPTLRIGQKDVWTHPYKDTPLPRDIYFNARRPRKPLGQ